MPRELLSRDESERRSVGVRDGERAKPSAPASPLMLGRQRASGGDLASLQRSVGNRAVLTLLQREGEDAPKRPDTPAPLSPPDMAHEAADEGLGHVQEAVITACAAFLVEHIFGTKKLGKRWGSSQREEVKKALEEAEKLADILAFAATRELRQGTGLYGTAEPGTDEHGLIRQRAQAKKKSHEDTSKKLQSNLLKGAVLEGARRVIEREQTRWFGPMLLEGRKTLFTAAEKAVATGTTTERLAAAKAAVAAELPAVIKKTTKEATKSLSGPKNKWVRDQLKDQTAQESVDVLGEEILEESGPNRQKAKLTKDTVEATFSPESVGAGLRQIGKLIDKHAHHNGDQTNITALLKIPVSHGFFVGLKVTGNASKASDTTSAGATFSFAAGWEAPETAQGLLELGGYLNTASDRGGLGCMEMASYTFYRRARESALIPQDLTSKLWGYGGITKKEGERGSEARYRESEAWANQIEENMTEEDLGEFGLHLGASGSGGSSKVGKAGGGVTVDTGTRYTKKGIEEARGRGKGTSKGTGLGQQSSIGQKVTTLSLNGYSQLNLPHTMGVNADATLAMTWDDKAKKLLAMNFDAGVGFKLPTGVAGQYAEWTGKAVRKVGAAITKAVNNANEGKSVKKQVKSAAKGDLKKAAQLAQKFPNLEKEVEAKLEQQDIYKKAHSGAEGLESQAKGLLDPRSHATKTAKHAKKKVSDTVMDKGFRVSVYCDVKTGEGYLAVQQTSSKDTTSTFHELTVSKSKAILYYDFATGTFEWGGQVVTTGNSQ